MLASSRFCDWMLPAKLDDRTGWAADIESAFARSDATLANQRIEAARVRNADGTRLLVDIEAESYKLLRSELGLTNEQLFQYLFYTRKLQQAKANDQLLVGLGEVVHDYLA